MVRIYGYYIRSFIYLFLVNLLMKLYVFQLLQIPRRFLRQFPRQFPHLPTSSHVFPRLPTSSHVISHVSSHVFPRLPTSFPTSSHVSSHTVGSCAKLRSENDLKIVLKLIIFFPNIESQYFENNLFEIYLLQLKM